VRLVLSGAVVTFDPAQPLLERGLVYVEDGRIAAVAPASGAAAPGFAGAPRIATGGVIYPGLIDLHSHMAYNTLPLWQAVGVPYEHHDRWTDEKRAPPYSTTISWPSDVLGVAAPEALIKYVEVKALIGGTTTLQGAPQTTRPVAGWLLRIADIERFGTGTDRVLTAALQRSDLQLREAARKMRDDARVLIYHVAEGRVGSVVHEEFGALERTGCLQPGLLGVHATALTPEDLDRWQRKVTAIDARQRATIVWSPFSNLWLYHVTTNVEEAHAKGIRIALGSDWSPSGTKHVLGELKVADLLNRQRFNRAFSDAQLCEMVTANPGEALRVAYSDRVVGRLDAGAEADLIVIERHRQDLYRNLIEATERHIRLVVIRGAPFYGTPGLMAATGAPAGDTITVAGRQRTVVVRQPGQRDAMLDWRQVRQALEAVRANPARAWRDAQDALAAWGGSLDDPEAPLALFGDMPEGELGLLGATAEIPTGLRIPRLDTLTHDARFHAAVAASGAPDLPGLVAYYR
jgi:5-methylthioadenosine/S-adenosylhomocysteine deaminase